MQPRLVMPMHDPAGVLFPHLKHAIPFLKRAFAGSLLSVTAVTLSRQRDWAAWLADEPFFDVLGGGDATRPGDQFAALYRHAAASSPPEQALHLGFVDRVVYALGSDFRDVYLADVNAATRADPPQLYHRSAAAWATHPANYRAMEGVITTAGEALLGRRLDFAWCYMTISAGRLAQLMPGVTRSDMSMLAEMVVGLRDELQVVEVDWLAWEDPYLLGRDAAELKRAREASPDEMRKRLGYVIPMLQVLAEFGATDGSGYGEVGADSSVYPLVSAAAFLSRKGRVRLSEGQRRILDAMRDGATLKVHRTVDGEKVHRLHPLEGSPVEVEGCDVESLKRRGLIVSNMKFPVATYLLTNTRG